MTSFITSDGNTLEYNGQDIAVTKQTVSFFDFKIKGDVSVSFDLPNTAKNRKYLNYYGFGQRNSAAYNLIPVTHVMDGNTLGNGNLIIEDSDDDYIRCYYVSGNANWFDALKFNLRSIDYSEYVVSAAGHDDRKALESGIVFPVVDWAFNGQKLGYTFCHTTGDDGIQEMFPCFYLHSLVKEVSKHANIKINGTLIDGVNINGQLIDDYAFKHIVITPEGPDMAWPDDQVADSLAVAKPIAVKAMTTTLQIMPLDYLYEAGGTQYSTSAYRYTAQISATFRVTLDFRASVSQSYVISLYKNGVLSGNFVATGTFNTIYQWRYENVTAGDYLEVWVFAASSGYNILTGTSVRYEIEKHIHPAYFDGTGASPSNPKAVTHIPYTTPAAIVPDITALELIKWVSFYFACIPVYDVESNTLVLDPLIYTKKEDAVDWSEYYVSHKVSWNTGAAKNNRIQTPELQDTEIKLYNKQNLTRYGGGTIVTDFEKEQENEVYEMPFGGSWDIPSQTSLRWFLPCIEFYKLENDLDNAIEYTSVTNSVQATGESARFDFPASSNTIGDNEVVLVVSSSGDYSGYGITFTTTSSQMFIRGLAFSATDTGKVIRQNISTNQSGHRILLVAPGSQVSTAGGQSFMVFRYANIGNTVNGQPTTPGTSSTACLAWFDKPKVGYAIDENRHSLSIDNILGREYNITIGDKYHSVMRSIFNGPRIKAKLRLPAAAYAGFNHSYVFIKSQDLTGYFLVEKIDRYLGPDTLTEVWLYGGN